MSTVESVFASAALFCLGSITASLLVLIRYLLDIKFDVAAIRRASESASGRTGELPDLQNPRR